MKSLIENYKRRLKTAEDHPSFIDHTKISLYREFISELERIQIEMPTDEDANLFAGEYLKKYYGTDDSRAYENYHIEHIIDTVQWLRDWIKNNNL
jgi:hypothetical protein